MVLAIYGASGLGREMLELANMINQQSNKWEEVIFADDQKAGNVIQGISVFSYEEIEKEKSDVSYIIAIGEPAIRKKLYEKLKKEKKHFETLIYPQIHIPETTKIGEGTMIGYGSFISCNAIIGNNVLIQPNSNFGHNSIIKDHSVLSGFGNVAGTCTIGECTYLGLSCSIRENTTIGDNTIIGMGAVVMKDIPEEVVAMGNPARVMRRNEEHRVFRGNAEAKH